MSLGETINRLRTEHGMSQGDLADRLNVSRQSISKWETDASVPELDKLVRLSELFGVSLDELVKGKPPEAAAIAPPPPAPEPQIIVERVVERHGMPGRKIAGTVLLCMAFVVAALLMLMGGLLEGLVLCLPFLICGIICFAARKHPGLWCAWAVFLMADSYLRYGTSLILGFGIIRYTSLLIEQGDFHILLMSWCYLLYKLGLIAATAMAFRQGEFTWTKRNRFLFAGGLVLYFLLYLPFDVWIFQVGGLDIVYVLIFLQFVLSSLRLMLLTALLTAVVRGIHGRKAA